MNIAICDDERQIREQIQEMVKRQMSDCVTGEFATGEELLADFSSWDILFLDIQLGGMDGIGTAKELRRREADVVLIFITALPDYVFDAFDVSAFHYLLKPVSEGKLADVLERAVGDIRQRDQAHTKKLLIRTRNRNVTMYEKDIYYIESQRRKVGIHTIKEVMEIYATMNEMESGWAIPSFAVIGDIWLIWRILQSTAVILYNCVQVRPSICRRRNIRIL